MNSKQISEWERNQWARHFSKSKLADKKMFSNELEQSEIYETDLNRKY